VETVEDEADLAVDVAAIEADEAVSREVVAEVSFTSPRLQSVPSTGYLESQTSPMPLRIFTRPSVADRRVRRSRR